MGLHGLTDGGGGLIGNAGGMFGAINPSGLISDNGLGVINFTSALVPDPRLGLARLGLDRSPRATTTAHHRRRCRHHCAKAKAEGKAKVKPVTIFRGGHTFTKAGRPKVKLRGSATLPGRGVMTSTRLNHHDRRIT